MTSALKGLSLFVVEDDIFTLLSLCQSFEDAGARVATATTVADGIEMSDARYDAAVLDVDLIDGEVHPLAKKLHTADTQLVFFTGTADVDDLQSRYPRAIAIAKPAPAEALIEALSPALA